MSGDVFVSPSLVGQFVILIMLEDTLRNAIDPTLRESFKDEIAAATRLALGFTDFNALWNATSQHIADTEEEYAFAFVEKDRSLSLSGGALHFTYNLRKEEKYAICFTEISLNKTIALSYRSTIFNNVLFFKRSNIKHLLLVTASSVRQQQEFYATQFGNNLQSCYITCSPPFAQTSTDGETIFYDLASFDSYFRIRMEREK